MNGRIPIEDYYVDDSEGGKGTHYKFGATYINKLIETSIPEQVKFLGSRRFLPSEDEEFDEEDRVRWQERLDFASDYAHKNYWPLVSMLQHPHLFEDKNVAVLEAWTLTSSVWLYSLGQRRSPHLSITSHF